jgi:FMN phosphatase YigB (HAD superfamily)
MIGNDLEMDIAPAATLKIAAIWVDHTGSGLLPTSPVRPTRTVTTLAEVL